MKIIETEHGTIFDSTVEVERGAALLDELTHGWEFRVEREQLDLSNGSRCVLGQLAIKDTILEELIEAVDGDHEYDGADEALKDLSKKGGLIDVELQFGKYKATRYGFFVKEGKVREYFAEKHPELDTPPARLGLSPGLFAKRSIEIQRLYARAWDHLTQDWSNLIEKRLASV